MIMLLAQQCSQASVLPLCDCTAAQAMVRMGLCSSSTVCALLHDVCNDGLHSV